MYRQIDTGTWDDPWFAELDPDAKLLFLYMLTNRRSTAAGVFEITLRAMAFETGLDTSRITVALESISSRVQWWPDHQSIWIRNFLRHQAVSPKFYQSAWSEMREMPEDIRESVGEMYPILTREEKPPESKEAIEALLIPYPKGIDRVSEPSRKTRLVKASTSLVETSSLESDGADAPTPPTPKPTPPKNKGTRLPADFTVTDEMRQWAIDKGATNHLIDSETEKFRLWWPAQPGAKGVKLDWSLTWKTWINRQLEKAHPGSMTLHQGGNPTPITPGPRGYTPDQLRRLSEQERLRETS